MNEINLLTLQDLCSKTLKNFSIIEFGKFNVILLLEILLLSLVFSILVIVVIKLLAKYLNKMLVESKSTLTRGITSETTAGLFTTLFLSVLLLTLVSIPGDYKDLYVFGDYLQPYMNTEANVIKYQDEKDGSVFYDTNEYKRLESRYNKAIDYLLTTTTASREDIVKLLNLELKEDVIVNSEYNHTQLFSVVQDYIEGYSLTNKTKSNNISNENMQSGSVDYSSMPLDSLIFHLVDIQNAKDELLLLNNKDQSDWSEATLEQWNKLVSEELKVKSAIDSKQ